MGHVVGISWEVTCIHQRLRQLEVGELRIHQRMRSMRVVATLECDGVTSIRRMSKQAVDTTAEGVEIYELAAKA